MSLKIFLNYVVFLIKKTKENGKMMAEKEMMDRASLTNEKFHRLPIIEIKANHCPKKKLFPFGTKLENFSQAFVMGLTIFFTAHRNYSL